MRIFASLVILILPFFGYCQDFGFKFGAVDVDDFEHRTYSLDTTASAIVLAEFQSARIGNDGSNKLVVDYHMKLKVLKPEGLRYGNFELLLFKGGKVKESVREVKAVSYNLIDGNVTTSELSPGQIFTQEASESYDLVKFPVPNVRVGSIVEIEYTTESPFYYKFQDWKIQSDIPKLSSEYHAHIPANFVYHITLKGYLTFQENTSEVVKGCFTPGEDIAIDCALYKWRMTDIPAFETEEYMKAASDYKAYLDFELSHIKNLDGEVKRFTKNWTDAAKELDDHPRFGMQWRRAREIFRNEMSWLKVEVPDEQARLRKIFEMIREHFTWNEESRLMSEDGVKNAYDKRVANSADINLTLIGALKVAGFETDPVIISTRDHGAPTELYPLLTDYNYVIARVKVGDQFILLDATDDYLPPGVLPTRCLNGKGRVLEKNDSYDIEIPVTEKSRRQMMCNFKLTAASVLEGTVTILNHGYLANEKRHEVMPDSSGYIHEFKKQYESISPSDYRIENLTMLQKPVRETFNIWRPFDASSDDFLIDPFFTGRWARNPFVPEFRRYPVDLEAPVDRNIVVTIELPAGVKLETVPAPVNIALPDNGGRLLYEVTELPDRILITLSYQLNKISYSPSEYRLLRAFFIQLIEIQNTELYLKRTL